MTHLSDSYDYTELVTLLPSIVNALRGHYSCIRWGTKRLSVELLVTMSQYCPEHDLVLVGNSVATELRFLLRNTNRTQPTALSGLLANVEPGVGLSRGTVIPTCVVGTLLGKTVVTDPEVPDNLLVLVRNKPDQHFGLTHVASLILVYPTDNGKPGCAHPSSQRTETYS